jgi:hypothetical protein
MPLDKFAKWGNLPPTKPVKPGIATVVDRGLPALNRQRQLETGLEVLKSTVDSNAKEITDRVDDLDASTRRLTETLDEIRADISRLDDLVRKKPPPCEIPSRAAQIVVWSLGPVRDALCDQTDPSFGHTNDLLERARERNQTVANVLSWLGNTYPKLAERYRSQLQALLNESGFDEERRRRLAMLSEFERDALGEVIGELGSSIGADRPITAKSTSRKNRARRS